ncbi:hypothetical protein AVDCRST_MAG94-3783 [uncultured Leptolyngbya sp.]|uniref:Uncharacterized protein n=2 Tax=Cyanophyceae TaxID=3028117 RepID=A0A6J4ILQ8_9CYAN|nr:hypothetical protein AVDCRST_MAG92-2131 [uncultured Coleofasciculus sp.]CAA9366737.1 hypothetical protein AVDCRST_MAG94-3783 [uncultured Leptolyngbya sp.]
MLWDKLNSVNEFIVRVSRHVRVKGVALEIAAQRWGPLTRAMKDS